jgi:predicted homoserine dehydrogenase-like protein
VNQSARHATVGVIAPPQRHLQRRGTCMTTTAESVVATRARSGQPLRVGIIGLGVREDLWSVSAHLPAQRAVPGFEVTALSTSSPESV